MKNIKNIISFLIMSIVLVSCNENGLENQDWLQQPNFANPLTLTLSSKEVILEKGDDAAMDANAITFTWTQANDRGAGTKLTYFFRMDILGQNFSEDVSNPADRLTITEEIPAGVFTKSYTVGELNKILLKRFGRPGGSVTNLEVQIIARVDNSAQFQLPEVSTSSFAVTSFSPGPLPLFMVGDAISGGWDYNTGKSLPEITERTKYTYLGDFSVGSFKIIEIPGSELPSYDPAVENTIVRNRTVPRNADNVFNITKAGRYYFSMDIEDEAGTYVLGLKPYDMIYMVGHAIKDITTDNGWNIGKAIPMKWDPKNPEEFSFKGEFLGGDVEGFKLYINKSGDWGADALMPPANRTKLIVDGPPTAMEVHRNANPDNKWDIVTTGTYELIVNPAKMTIQLKSVK